MKRKRLLLLALGCALIGAFVRVGYQPLSWGGYWYVDLVTPWR